MGVFEFIGSVGRKLGELTGSATPSAEAQAQMAKAIALSAQARAAAASHEKDVLHRQSVVADITAALTANGLHLTELVVAFDGERVTLKGQAVSQADAEKAVLVAGNSEGVTSVDDQLVVTSPEPRSVQHTVVRGETLSAIAAKHYGVMRLYGAVFSANQPMLAHPDRIYPGQVLRIPAVQPPTHIVVNGETLGSIAKYWYGDSSRYVDIAKANTLADPNAVEVGRILTIPLQSVT